MSIITKLKQFFCLHIDCQGADKFEAVEGNLFKRISTLICINCHKELKGKAIEIITEEELATEEKQIYRYKKDKGLE